MNYPDKQILVVREFEVQLVPCAIPYIFGATLGGSDKDIAASIPGAQKQFVKLLAMRHGGQVIGGQIIGGNEVGEMINIIGVMIEANLTIYQVMSMQMATQPMLTAAPTNYPIVMAATMIAQKI